MDLAPQKGLQATFAPKPVAGHSGKGRNLKK
jgi:glutamine synthetase